MTTSTKHYDVIIIGAGPAGYVSAIRCGQQGLKTLCVDSWADAHGRPSLGGTYVNAGCIPSLTLLESSRQYTALQSQLAQRGIIAKDVELDLATMIAHKDQVVRNVSDQIAELFRNNGVESIHGRGLLKENHQVLIMPHGSDQAEDFFLISAENVILASGSSPVEISAARVDGEIIVASETAMAFSGVPRNLGVIGAGVIGLEHAGIWAGLGSNVILLEAQDEFLPFCDCEIAGEAIKLYQQRGLDIRLGARVTATQLLTEQNQVEVEYQDHNGMHTLILDKLIIAAGRKPNTTGLVADEVELILDEQGFINTDSQCMTSIPGVYAIGDLIRGPMLAHKGAEEGLFVADVISGKTRELNYEAIPNVIYTDPEIAWVGASEQSLIATGEDYKKAVVPFSGNAKAHTMGRTSGFAKILSQTGSDKLLGLHLIGNNISEMIAEGVLALEFGASTEDLARTIHANPTMSKAIHDAAQAINRKALHGYEQN